METCDTSGSKRSKKVRSATKHSSKDQSQLKVKTPSAENAIDNVFHAFDEHRNGRITTKNIRSVAAEHGIDMTSAELNDMISFFDNSGTATLSRSDFEKLWQETSS